MSEADCEARIRVLLAGYGEVGQIIIARRDSAEHPWVAAVEMRNGHKDALAALQGSTFEGQPLRVRLASPVDAASLL